LLGDIHQVLVVWVVEVDLPLAQIMEQMDGEVVVVAVAVEQIMELLLEMVVQAEMVIA
jgi:hypothetical protein